MISHTSPRPAEPDDVMIRVHWDNVGGECMDLFFRACASAARRFAHSFNTTHEQDTVTVSDQVSPSCSARLPYERNWLVP
ncbi:hypothetical protein AWN90_07720 [Nocardia terpenica]|uniref:Uncharacterized protein n=1 Tax=Nocardia terpenica TaxID=455432 RepID=A0A164IQB6_9NOCA|nr:hypothetical protein AWN90_07720 [Nocardia terpenica]